MPVEVAPETGGGDDHGREMVRATATEPRRFGGQLVNQALAPDQPAQADTRGEAFGKGVQGDHPVRIGGVAAHCGRRGLRLVAEIRVRLVLDHDRAHLLDKSEDLVTAGCGEDPAGGVVEGGNQVQGGRLAGGPHGSTGRPRKLVDVDVVDRSRYGDRLDTASREDHATEVIGQRLGQDGPAFPRQANGDLIQCRRGSSGGEHVPRTERVAACPRQPRGQVSA